MKEPEQRPSDPQRPHHDDPYGPAKPEPHHHDPPHQPDRPHRPKDHHRDEPCCPEVPEFIRLKYFYGQMLGAADFQTEQDFFREKLKLHNRCLHGYGVVCGLAVIPKPMPEDCDPPRQGERGRVEQEIKQLEERRHQATEDQKAKIQAKIGELKTRLGCLPKDDCEPPPRSHVLIECGVAYDCEGNELVVRRTLDVDLMAHLSPVDARRVLECHPASLYVSLCYCPQPIDPVRPVQSDACGAIAECTPGKVRDSVRVRVTVDPPCEDERCEPCCCPCKDPCLLLARIDCFVPGEPVCPEQIHNEVRRMLSRYDLTRVSGISWTHGAHYTISEAYSLLGADKPAKKGTPADPHRGLEIRFSRPIRSSTVREGVIDLWVTEGGRGRRGNLYNLEGEILWPPAVGAPEYVDHIHYRQTTGETLQSGDRVLVILRAAFLLDKCCYAVDGENIGGRVPIILPKYECYQRDTGVTECCAPPHGFPPWRSGDGVQAGTFESWFFICRDKEEREEECDDEAR